MRPLSMMSVPELQAEQARLNPLCRWGETLCLPSTDSLWTFEARSKYDRIQTELERRRKDGEAQRALCCVGGMV